MGDSLAQAEVDTDLRVLRDRLTALSAGSYFHGVNGLDRGRLKQRRPGDDLRLGDFAGLIHQQIEYDDALHTAGARIVGVNRRRRATSLGA